MNMSNSLLQQRPYENFLIPKQQKNSFMESLLPMLAGGVAQGVGSFGGGAGSMWAGKKMGLFG